MSAKLNETGIVHRTINRTETNIVEQLARFDVATVHEALGRTGLLDSNMRPAWQGARMCGTAVTVLLPPGDNWMMHVVAEQIRPGDVVVAASMSSCSDGYFGDLLATSFKARGAKGLIIDAGVRDVDTLQAMKFPVFSRNISAQGTVKATLGSVNIPLVCAGAVIHPGDVVLADTDGVVIVPAQLAAQVASKAQARREREADKRAAFAAGTLGLDLYQMREKLERAGLRYID